MILFIDDFTRATWIMLMKNKFEAFNKFKYFNAHMEKEIYLKIKCLISNTGHEYMSKEFDYFYEEYGIKRKYSIVRTP